MSTIYKLKKSRECWKEKSIERGDRVRYLTKENHRLKLQHKQDQKKLAELKARLDEEQKNHIPRLVKDKAALVFLALQLFLVARISFRAVSRVLSVLAPALGIQQAPSHQTIINWLQRFSIVQMQSLQQFRVTANSGTPLSNGFIWLIDISIGLGVGKILTVLALDAHHHCKNSGAPTLENTHCVGVAVASSWNGETIAHFLKKIIGVLGRPDAYLKDGGTDLGRAARLLSEDGFASPCIDDVSHKIANLVKDAYGNHPLFAVFLSACGKVSKKLKQTLLACLAPPKVSIKARFMNLHRLVIWADNILKQDIPGAAEQGSLLEKLRASLCELPQCKEFITAFIRDVMPLMACQKIIKSKGLSHETYADCKKFIEQIPPESSIRLGFDEWATQQLAIAKKLDIEQLPISTDQLESLFGVGKRHGTGNVKDANQIATRLPALCGTLTIDDARKVLAISVQEHKALMNTDTLTKQRRKVLGTPGNLETLLPRDEKQYIELIPEPKNRLNIDVTHCNKCNIFDSHYPAPDTQPVTEEQSTCFSDESHYQENIQNLNEILDG